jgi:hypothetical protein
MSGTTGSWEAGETPWLRERRHGPAITASGYAQCYFCGEHTVKVSVGDLSADTGRVEIYCDNQDCDAREMTVLVTRDGHHAGERADARILHSIDTDKHTTEWGPIKGFTLDELVNSDRDEAGIRARRQSRDPASYAAPGYGEGSGADERPIL